MKGVREIAIDTKNKIYSTPWFDIQLFISSHCFSFMYGKATAWDTFCGVEAMMKAIFGD